MRRRISGFVIFTVFLFGIFFSAFAVLPKYALGQSQITAFNFDEKDNLEGWKEAWSGAMKSAKDLRWTDELSEDGKNGAIRVDVAFDSTNSWHDFNIGKWLGSSEGSPADLSYLDKIEFDVILEKSTFEKSFGNIAIKAALNGDPGGWADIDGEYNINKNTATSKVSLSAMKVKDKEYTKIHVTFGVKDELKTNKRGQLVIQIAGQNSDYSGPLYIDNIKLLADKSSGQSQGVNIPKPTFEAINFSDVQNHWAKNEITFISSLSDAFKSLNNFEPDKKIRKGELIDWLVKSFGITSDAKDLKFNDVSQLSKYYGSISVAYSKGIIKGDENGNIKPNEVLTRQEAIAIIIRTVEVLKGQLNVDSSLVEKFTDSADTDAWAKDYIAKAISIELINGYKNNSLRLKNVCTRAEASVMLYRAYNYLTK